MRKILVKIKLIKKNRVNLEFVISLVNFIRYSIFDIDKGKRKLCSTILSFY